MDIPGALPRKGGLESDEYWSPLHCYHVHRLKLRDVSAVVGGETGRDSISSR